MSTLVATSSSKQDKITFTKLPEEILLNIIKYLSDEDKFNIMRSDPHLAHVLESSKNLLLNFKFELSNENLEILANEKHMAQISYKNIVIRCIKEADKLKKFHKILQKNKTSPEILTIENFQRILIKEFIDFHKDFLFLRILTLKRCKFSEQVENQILNPLPCLEEINFEKCDRNCFKLFKRQETIQKISVTNHDWTWNGFSHEDFNDLVATLKNLYWITFNGTGTGSYFDSDHFPYRIKKLDTFLISFQWYVGIKTARVNFLQSQKGYLKELTIHQLPYDFDGGKVLRYIIESMELESFYYGKTPLILNGQKQEVKEVKATEVQTTSLYEMFYQFPTIKILKLFLTETDIDSNEVERIIDEPTTLFHNVEHFEVLDHSGNKHLLGVFLGIYKNLQNVKSIKFESHDMRINLLLNEFLFRMISLESIEMDSRAPNAEERFQIIRNFVPNLKSLGVAPEYMQLCRQIFNNDVDIYEMILQDY